MSQFFNPFSVFEQAAAAWADAGARMIEASVGASRAMTAASVASWAGTFNPTPDPARSWYRAPAPQMPAWPMAQMFAMPALPQPWAWPMAMWQPAASLSSNAFNPMALWTAFTPFASAAPAPTWNTWALAPQSAMAGPLTKACTTFWIEMMRQGMAASTSPAAMTALVPGADFNPFAAYRSNGGHAVAQITFADTNAPSAFDLFNPAWMMAALTPFGSKRVH